MVRPKILVCGILFWYPLAGVTYQTLHYLRGLRKLGYDVYYIEDSGRYIFDPMLNDVSPDAARNVAAIAPVLEEHGFAGRWAFRGNYPGGACYGLSESELLQLYRDADALLNVTGSQELRVEHLRIPRRVYIETDPVASQIRVAKGEPWGIEQLDLHHVHFSFGENFGRPDCRVPIVRYDWLPTRQPVDLEMWQPQPPSSTARYNTIATWKNLGKDIEWQGEEYYWSKDREFVKFIELPRKSGRRFQLACKLDPENEKTFLDAGWTFLDPYGVSNRMADYHDFICGSRGEFTVAKDQNIRLRSGWFSDRTACYLAAGRPVLTQDTAFGNILPTGKGLFGFLTMEDILTALESIESDYDGHCQAARQIAEEYFAADKVLASLMARAQL
jgi:hypothetical protein